MNRIAILLNKHGEVCMVASDEPVRCFIVDDNAPQDRVYEFTEALKVGPEHVRELLRDDPIGHALDDHDLGEGYGPRKPPSRPSLTVVD